MREKVFILFSNLKNKYHSKIFYQIFTKFSVIVLFSFIISFIFNSYTNNFRLNRRNQASNANNIEKLLSNLMQNALRHTSQELDQINFYKEGQSEYTHAFAKSYSELISGINSEYFKNEQNQYFSSIESRIKKINETFFALVRLELELGFENYGLEGSWRSELHKVENEVKTSNAKLFMSYLQLRRYEKDYIIRANEKSIKTWNLNLSEFKAICGNNLKYNNFLNAILNYEQLFLKYVNSDNKRSKLTSLLKNEYENTQIELDKLKTERRLKHQKNYDTMALFSFLFPLIIISIFIIIIKSVVKNITDPIHKIVNFASQINQGNFEHNFHLNRKDEFGILKRSLIEMVDSLKLLNTQTKMALIGEVSANIVHDLRNPLSIISGNNHLLETKILETEINKDSSTLIKHTKSIRKSIDRINRIIESIQAMSKAEGNELFKVIRLNEIIEDSISFIELKAKESGVELIRSEISEDIKVNSKGVQLSQMIINLISNAIYAINKLDEKWVKIDTELENDYVAIFVTDSGFGIPVNIKNKLFNSSVTTKPGEAGTGIGLLLCKKIVVQHGGTIQIVDDKHTKFKITLPIIK